MVLMPSEKIFFSVKNLSGESSVVPSLVPRPSRAPAQKGVWNLSQDFLALLNQHDVFYVIQNDCHVLWAYGPIPKGHIPMRAYTLGNWNWNQAVFQYAFKSHDCFESCVLIDLSVFQTC